MQHGDQRAEAELPFEAEPHIDRDRRHCDQHGDDAAMHQLLADLRPDRFGAAQVVLGADCVLDQLDRHLLAPFGALLGRHVDLGGVGRPARQLALEHGEADAAHRVAPAGGVERAGRGEFDVAQLGVGQRLDAPAIARALLHHLVGMGDARGIALLTLHADQRGGVVAEFLQRDFADPQRAQGGAQLIEVDRALLGAHLHGDAAFEVDAEVETDEDDAQERQDVDRRRQAQRPQALAHEVELGVGGNEMNGFPEHGGLRSPARSAAASAPRRPAACG